MQRGRMEGRLLVARAAVVTVVEMAAVTKGVGS
jgi:hypothetical protein